MPLLNKIRFISIFLIISFLTASVTISKEDIDNAAARDIYDILSKVYTLRGYSLGIVGQPVFFTSTGRRSSDIILYIDNIYYGKEVSDMSFISIDRIEKIVIDEMSLEGPGITVKIYTKNLNADIPVSEVNYRDAFFNYRDLTANIAQRVGPDMKVSAYGEILDFKDHREYSDTFNYPYMKQNFGLTFDFQSFYYFKPVLDLTYLTENKYLLYSDSSLTRSEIFRSSLKLETDNNNGLFNRFGVTAVSDDDMSLYNVDVFDEISITTGATSEFTGKTGFTSEGSHSFSAYAKAAYTLKSFIDTGLQGFSRISDMEGSICSARLDLQKDIGIAVLSNSSAYFYQKDRKEIDFFENSATAEKEFKIKDTGFCLRTGLDLITENDRKYYRGGFTAGKNSRIVFRSDIIVSANRDKTDDIVNNLVTSLTFSDRYFNEKLNFNMSFNHRYSEYYIRNSKETLNNLSFNLRARIVNFEFYYGSDNFLKDHYNIGNVSFDLNDHYVYSTVEGFDMRTHDEIWGVRWIFYR